MNVLNGKVEAFETMPVELEVESAGRQLTRRISALTTDRVTGNLRIIDWRKESNKEYPFQSRVPCIPLLIF